MLSLLILLSFYASDTYLLLLVVLQQTKYWNIKHRTINTKQQGIKL